MEPIFLTLGEGERIAGDGELGVDLLADLEQIGVSDVRAKPSDGTPPLHLHNRHAECFLVLEGELEFRLEDRELRAGPETWVLVPPEVVHTFTVTGDATAHFLNVHVPSCGYGDFVRGLRSARDDAELHAVRTAFDQQAVPEYGGADPGSVLVRGGPAAGETIADSPGRRVALVVDIEEIAVTEFVYGPGRQGAQPHVHHLHVDAFLVVAGELRIGLGEGSLHAPVGTLVLIPPGVVHSFGNNGSETAHFFNFHTPSCGFGDYLRGQNPDFDQHDPPADGGGDPVSVIAVRLPGSENANG